MSEGGGSKQVVKRLQKTIYCSKVTLRPNKRNPAKNTTTAHRNKGKGVKGIICEGEVGKKGRDYPSQVSQAYVISRIWRRGGPGAA